MSENNQIDEMCKISYLIHIEKKEYPKELIELLKKNNIEFEALQVMRLQKEYDDSPEELSYIALDNEIYNKLKKISEITGIPMGDMASNELEHMLTDTLPEIPLIFLDAHLGIENVENPFEMLEKMNEVINIGDKYLNWLKTQDPVKYVEEWKHPLKDFKKT